MQSPQTSPAQPLGATRSHSTLMPWPGWGRTGAAWVLLPPSGASGCSFSPPTPPPAQGGEKPSVPSIGFPMRLTPPIAMETRGDVERGDAAWPRGSRSGKGSRRRRGDGHLSWGQPSTKPLCGGRGRALARPPHPTDTPVGLRCWLVPRSCAFPLSLSLSASVVTGARGRKAPPSPARDCCQISAPPAFLPSVMCRGFSYTCSSKAVLFHFLMRTIKALADFSFLSFFFFHV